MGALGQGGSSICEHDRDKSVCKLCKMGTGGGSLCEHNRERRYCTECRNERTDPRSMCEHNLQRRYCQKCTPSFTGIAGKPNVAAATVLRKPAKRARSEEAR